MIIVSYDVSGTDWQLAVADNGSGKPDGVFAQPKTGLGTGVVKALARQLDAQVVTLSSASGTKVFGYSRHVCSRVIYDSRRTDHRSYGRLLWEESQPKPSSILKLFSPRWGRAKGF